MSPTKLAARGAKSLQVRASYNGPAPGGPKRLTQLYITIPLVCRGLPQERAHTMLTRNLAIRAVVVLGTMLAIPSASGFRSKAPFQRDLVPAREARLAIRNARATTGSFRAKPTASTVMVSLDSASKASLAEAELLELKSDDGTQDGVGIVGDGPMIVNRLTPPRYPAIVKS